MKLLTTLPFATVLESGDTVSVLTLNGHITDMTRSDLASLRSVLELAELVLDCDTRCPSTLMPECLACDHFYPHDRATDPEGCAMPCPHATGPCISR